MRDVSPLPRLLSRWEPGRIVAMLTGLDRRDGFRAFHQQPEPDARPPQARKPVARHWLCGSVSPPGTSSRSSRPARELDRISLNR